MRRSDVWRFQIWEEKINCVGNRMSVSDKRGKLSTNSFTWTKHTCTLCWVRLCTNTAWIHLTHWTPSTGHLWSCFVKIMFQPTCWWWNQKRKLNILTTLKATGRFCPRQSPWCKNSTSTLCTSIHLRFCSTSGVRRLPWHCILTSLMRLEASDHIHPTETEVDWKRALFL